MPSVRISPGRLTALWVIVRSLHKLGGDARSDEVRRYASRTSLRSGGLPIGDGLTLALEGGFVSLREERLAFTALGRDALALESEDEPGPALIRMFLSALLLRDPPSWVAFWQGDPSTADLVIPESERRLLNESGLLPIAEPDDLANWSLWEALRRVPLPEEAGAFRKRIGDAGEELSFEFERDRLSAEGFPELAAQVRWVAKESPAYGFDILSFNGRSHGGMSPQTTIGVEVKSCSRPTPSRFPFFLTIHEWDTAGRLGDRYRFHFWDGVDPGPPCRARKRAPRVVAQERIGSHLPKTSDCNDPCGWYTAEVSLPVG